MNETGSERFVDEPRSEQGSGDGTGRQPKKQPRKALVAAAVVIGVLVVCGIGFAVWHDQPSFCNAICHDPMDSYVEGYESSDSSLLVTTHARTGSKCLDCHEAKLDEQLTEGMKWLSGDFETPLDSSDIGSREFCLECHGDEWDSIVASTADMKGTKTVYNPEGLYNPHDNHRGDDNCSMCHSMHEQSTLYCVECHNIEVPDGWNGFE
ncbi:cytochrome c3 family protein [Arabiibacter massiliensis]|uniref:cytochrome c3 family protein n=1 Tax=Arabiibacter massiliensis TaxID=1870985 RepID=UPI0009B98383|nr:cytochrome c3 family protein [Arabiibacter massiliensis]